VRVLHLSRGYPPAAFDGAAVAVGELCAGLAGLGAEVRVVSIEEGGGGREGDERRVGAWVVRCPESGAREAAESLTAGWRPEVVHFHDHRDLALALGMAGTAAAVVFSPHELYLDEVGQPRNPEYVRGQDEAVARADLVLLPSRAGRERMLRHRPEAAAKTRVVPHGLRDTPAAQAAAYERAPAAEPTLLYCGRVSRQKGAHLVLEAVPEILERVPAARFDLVGLQDYPKQRAMVEGFLGALPPALAGRVAVHSWQPRETLSPLYARADVVVVPSRNELFGLVTLEAMLHGCAVLATETDGARELIEHEKTGLLIPVADATALAAAAIRLLADPHLRARLGRAAADEARTRHVGMLVAQRVLGLYPELHP
jgi:glycosyltransferase involved in cell wall biosynthesis